jgi:tetratricopeptide (TPR) repeat protein
MPRVKASAEKALQLDNTLAEAHCSLGVVLTNFWFNWTDGNNELRRAIALNPNYAYAHDQYGYNLAQLEHFDQALAENMRAVELDPLSPEIRSTLVFTLAVQGHYESAIGEARRGLPLMLAWTEIQAGKFKQAIPDLQKARSTTPAAQVIGFLGYAYAASGDRTNASAVLDELRHESAHRFVSPLCAAIVYLGLGDRQHAMEGLEGAYQVHDAWLTTLRVDRIYDPLRSDPRFIKLLQKVGLSN